MVPVLHIVWVGEDQHGAAVASLLTANRRLLSLVDCVSFATMRRLSIVRAFACDRRFSEQGFELVGPR